jgi:hypothetical protein
VSSPGRRGRRRPHELYAARESTNAVAGDQAARAEVGHSAAGAAAAADAEGAQVNIVYLTRPQTTAITTLARVKQELRIASDSVDAARDAFLQQLIVEASDALPRQGGRQLARGQVREAKQGTDSTSMLLSLTPVVELDSVIWRNDPIENTDDPDIPQWELIDPAAGLLFRYQTWVATGYLPVGIVRDALPGRSREDWKFTYWGGYLLPGDNVAASGYLVSASGRTITRRVGAPVWPLLVSGDSVVVAFPHNAGPFTVLARSDDVVTFLELLADDVGDASSSVAVQTLPPSASAIAAKVVKAWYNATYRPDPRITAESIGDYSYTLTPGLYTIPQELLDEWLYAFGRSMSGDL